MKAALLTLAAVAAFAQQYSSPSAEFRDYLSLTRAQAAAMEQGYAAYLVSVDRAQQRTGELYTEIAVEEARESPDPSTLGRLYGEMETIRRRVSGVFASFSASNRAAMTPAQTARLAVLTESRRLLPLANDGVCAGLIEPGPPAVSGPAGRLPFPGSIIPASRFTPFALFLPGCFAGTDPSLAITLYLDLSTRQSVQLGERLQNFLRWREEKSSRMQELERESAGLTASPVLDVVALGLVRAEIVSIRKEIQREQARVAAESRATLTAAQVEKLRPLMAAEALTAIFSEAEVLGLIDAYRQ